MLIPSAAQKALDLLEKAGFEAFVVGGCVRDSLRGDVPHDWDITTNALPLETKQVFDGFKVIETGIKHGTVAVLIEDTLLEITTYRVDGEYLDNRHPSEVTFTPNLKDDLARRDFTINAMACSRDGKLVDEFTGQEDLEAGVIRCVGSPDKRFSEDALRIMRALRFSSVLDFDIEEETAKSIHKNASLLKNIAVERIAEELLKLLCGVRVTDILIEYRDVFAVIIPELEPCFDYDQKNKHHIYSVYDHIAHSVGSVEPLPDVRLALLLHDIGKPNNIWLDENGAGHFPGHAERSAEMAKAIMSRLHLSNDMRDTVYELIFNHHYPVKADRKEVRKCLFKFGPELFEKLIIVKIGDNDAHNLKTGNFRLELENIQTLISESLDDCYDLSRLKISGNDLKELGYEGLEIRIVLESLLFKVMEEELSNDHEKLIERAKELGTGKA